MAAFRAVEAHTNGLIRTSTGPQIISKISPKFSLHFHTIDEHSRHHRQETGRPRTDRRRDRPYDRWANERRHRRLPDGGDADGDLSEGYDDCRDARAHPQDALFRH